MYNFNSQKINDNAIMQYKPKEASDFGIETRWNSFKEKQFEQ